MATVEPVTTQEAPCCCSPAAQPSPCDEGSEVLEQVKDYYGQRLQSSSDLKTSACGCGTSSAGKTADILELIASEVKDRCYGCGSPIPQLQEGMTVLDLGCGSGLDCYIASKLVGEQGHVIGVDMTTEQLEVARRYQLEQAQRFGYRQSNVEFVQGYIEDLAAAGIAAGSVDVVISNCVINLSPRKDLVFAQVARVLKDGGQLYFADVFASAPIPPAAAADPEVRGECLGGAMTVGEFATLMDAAGFNSYEFVESAPLQIEDDRIAALLEGITFTSRTVRAFKQAQPACCC
jgi:ubiquinone/menaquinone biosynthesis C-methylase UbiE